MKRPLAWLATSCVGWFALTALAAAEPAVSPADAAMAAGSDAAQRGSFARAATAFAEAERLYGERGSSAERAQALIQRAEALQALGSYRDALAESARALALAESLGDARLRAASLSTRGSVELALGNTERAVESLGRSAALARKAGAGRLLAGALVNLGNAEAGRGRSADAQAAYTEAVSIADETGDVGLAVRARANAAHALLESDPPGAALPLLEAAAARIDALAASHQKAYTAMSLARSYRRLGDAALGDVDPVQRSYGLLEIARDTADSLDDDRAASAARGYLGRLYQERGRVDEALTLTQQAVFRAQEARAEDLLYRWHGQAGDLHRIRGERDAAIGQYQAAVEILSGMRDTLSRGHGAGADSFRTQVGPIYFALVDLLLQRAASQPDAGARQRDLRAAQSSLELLKAAELRDYFRDECVDAFREARTSAASASATAAVVYPILLPDRIEILVSVGSGIRRYATPVGSAQVRGEVGRLRRLLEKRTTREYLRPAEQLHRWLIEPFQDDLGPEVDTLVFVPDGALRTVPMSALHDGRRFLAERYAVAITPGLELTDARPLDRANVKALLGGVSQAVQGFPSLRWVGAELSEIEALYPADVLIDEDFVRARVQEELRDQQLSVVHIASHAEFSGDVGKSFVLTYEGRLGVDELADYVGLFQYREVPLGLLALSACETAQSDERAALGLSGIAVKAGARSALGTLWTVADEAAYELVVEFYRQLRDDEVSKAEALRRAQQKLLAQRELAHPYYWSAFLLIGNWL